MHDSRFPCSSEGFASSFWNFFVRSRIVPFRLCFSNLCITATSKTPLNNLSMLHSYVHVLASSYFVMHAFLLALSVATLRRNKLACCSLLHAVTAQCPLYQTWGLFLYSSTNFFSLKFELLRFKSNISVIEGAVIAPLSQYIRAKQWEDSWGRCCLHSVVMGAVLSLNWATPHFLNIPYNLW